MIIICKECGKEISDKSKQCIHCGCPIENTVLEEEITKIEETKTITCELEDSNNKINDIQTKDSIINTIKGNKKIMAIFGIAIVAILCFFTIHSRQGYSYERRGLYGFDNAIKWDMNKSEVEVLEIFSEEAKQENDYLDYDDITLFGSVKGDLFISFKDEGDMEIASIQFEVTDSRTPEEIGTIISEGLGEPIHKKNFNNERIYEPKWMWVYSENQYLILYENTTWGGLYIDWEIADTERIERAKDVMANIDEDQEFYEAYTLLLDRSKYEDASIELVIEELGITEYEINEGTNLSGIYYSYDTVSYIEHVDLFGHKGKLEYRCYNPYDEDYPDFIGKVEFITYKFTDKISKEESEELQEKILKYTGREDVEDTNISLPITINYQADTRSIGFSPYEDYYLINPEYGYDDSTEEVEGYKNCDVELLHLELDYTKHEISKYSDAAEDCWALAKNEVKNNLKVPSSASFPNPNIDGNALFICSGDIYQVTSYVEAENSFGAKIKTYFLVELKRSGNSYRVVDVTFGK